MNKKIDKTPEEIKKPAGRIVDSETNKSPEPEKTADDLQNIPEPKKQRKPRMTKAIKAEMEKEKQKESLEFAKLALPQGLTAIEELLLNRLSDKNLVNKLKLSEPEKTAFTESLVMVAEKRGWFKAQDTPEIALAVTVLAIAASRIEIIKEYRNAKSKKSVPEVKTGK